MKKQMKNLLNTMATCLTVAIVFALSNCGGIMNKKQESSEPFVKSTTPSEAAELSGQNAQLIHHLNKALADEWLAYYQYWVGAKVARGDMKKDVVAELLQHATDEKRHADMLADRIMELGGKPLLDFAQLQKYTACGYLVPPTDGSLRIILEQNIKGERCAIHGYKELAAMTKDNDQVTFKMISEILADEEEHDRDLSGLLKKM